MPARMIDGKLLASAMRAGMRTETEALRAKNVFPALSVILVGGDGASQVYVRNKRRACDEVGILCRDYLFPENTGDEELLALISELNRDPRVDGILVQLPLPKHLDGRRILEAVSPDKDVDGFHPMNVGRLLTGNCMFAPCTPSGIIELIRSTGVPIEGRECVVIGRSNIVGKPTAVLLMQNNGTVTVCHSRTRNLPSVTRRAEILVSAVGKAGFVTKEMVRPGALVIDVGMNRDADGRLCGDVAADEVSRVAGFLTPVPGGVGPMTVTMLLRNTLLAAEKRAG